MTTCIIAEKPSVARDIARIVGATTKQDGYLAGNGYLVTWAMGHLMTLAMPEAYGYSNYKAEELPICPNPFQLIVRQVRKDKEFHEDPAALKQLKAIGSCFNQADRIIVATDAGREGELIFRWIYRHLNSHKPFDRLWISSLTDKAIREGLANIKPGSHYDHLYYAAQARAEADWLMGINASRALSIAYRGGYSLGRVQTPTLAMVCHRYMEHRDFTAVPYWKLTAMIEDEGLSIKAVSLQNFDDEAAAQTALTSLRSIGSLTVTEVTRKVTHTAPPLLYDLTALQKEANVRHGFSADKTLTLAQSLYEKKIPLADSEKSPAQIKNDELNEKAFALYDPVKPRYSMPYIMFSRQDAGQIGNNGTLAGPIHALASETYQAIIYGDFSIDAEWDAYVQNLKTMGVERLIDIYQGYVDKYYTE